MQIVAHEEEHATSTRGTAHADTNEGGEVSNGRGAAAARAAASPLLIGTNAKRKGRPNKGATTSVLQKTSARARSRRKAKPGTIKKQPSNKVAPEPALEGEGQGGTARGEGQGGTARVEVGEGGAAGAGTAGAGDGGASAVATSSALSGSATAPAAGERAEDGGNTDADATMAPYILVWIESKSKEIRSKSYPELKVAVAQFDKVPLGLTKVTQSLQFCHMSTFSRDPIEHQFGGDCEVVGLVVQYSSV
jgi:hypothetical protein